jgi:hypothetical protein
VADTPGPPPAGDGFVLYDELTGPELDAARWSHVRLPLPSGEEHDAWDRGAELTVADGAVEVTIPRFSIAHDRFQAADSAKFIVCSTDRYDLSPDRPATFAADLAVTNVGGDPGDYRAAMAAFHVFDLEVTTRVISVCGTSTRVLALDEQLAPRGSAEPFIYMAESPYEDFDDDFTRPRACEITLDRRASSAVWSVDGRTIYRTAGTVIPDAVRIGFGIWTMVPIRNGRSRSVRGQGLTARWSRLRFRGVDADPR